MNWTKLEEQHLKLINKGERETRARLAKFFKDLESMIERGSSDRVIENWVKKELNKLDKSLNVQLEKNIKVAVDTANLTATKLIRERAGNNIELFKKYELSPNVWKNTTDLLAPIKEALNTGESAKDLAKNLLSNLEENRHGRGIYKDPMKNAMRVARTEINQAYRTADSHNWAKIDFVIGKEIRLSNSPKKMARCEICRSLAGKYPSDFLWYGFHPMCMCYQIPIQVSDEEFFKMQEDPSYKPELIGVPKNYTTFVKTQGYRFANYKTKPYWLDYKFKEKD